MPCHRLSACENLLSIQTHTIKDEHLKALADSGATKIFCSDSFVQEKILSTQSLTNPLRIRLADGNMSMTRYGVNVEFHTDLFKITQEFIVARFSGQHQTILGYDFLKNLNPRIDWTAGKLRCSGMEAVQAIIAKRIADVNHLSGKHMSGNYY